MHSVDIFVNNYFSLAQTPVITKFMFFVTDLFEISVHFIVMILLVALLVYFLRGFRHSELFLLSLGAGTIIVYFSKFLFNVPRPLGGVVFESTQSFPSYHATMATIFFIMLMYIFDDYFKNFWRVVFNTFCIIFVFLICLSRLYLGVHWFSDVFAGVILGSFVSYISIKIFSLYRSKSVLE